MALDVGLFTAVHGVVSVASVLNLWFSLLACVTTLVFVPLEGATSGTRAVLGDQVGTLFTRCSL